MDTIESPYPLWGKIQERLVNFQDIECLQDLYEQPETKESVSFRHDMLVLRRNYIIHKVKAPLQKALESVPFAKWWNLPFVIIELFRILKRYPRVTLHNATKANAKVLVRVENKFFEYEDNPSREPIFHTVFKIANGQVDHDNYYGSRECWVLEEHIKAILDGTFIPRPEDYPDPRHWKEPRPYGGKYTIIYKMQQKRKEILKLLEEVD